MKFVIGQGELYDEFIFIMICPLKPKSSHVIAQYKTQTSSQFP